MISMSDVPNILNVSMLEIYVALAKAIAERECVCKPLYLLDAPFQITYHAQECVFNDQCIEFILVSRYKTDSHRTS